MKYFLMLLAISIATSIQAQMIIEWAPYSPDTVKGRITTDMGINWRDFAVIDSSSYHSLFDSVRYEHMTYGFLPNDTAIVGVYDEEGWMHPMVLPEVPTNTNQLVNGSGFITSEVDGSITNEIELPSQTGNAGKHLVTNGSTTSWADTLLSPVTGTPSRSFNSNFTPSTTRYSLVNYVVTLSASVAALGGTSVSQVFLEASSNGGSSWRTVDVASNSQTFGLTVSFSATQVLIMSVDGLIFPNELVRLRSTGSGTHTETLGQVNEAQL